MAQTHEWKKYLVCYSERSDGPQCNDDYVWLIESPVIPTEDLLREHSMIITGSCTNVSYPGCENCGGSRIVDFHVEEFSAQRAKEWALFEKLVHPKVGSSCLEDCVRRLTPRGVVGDKR